MKISIILGHPDRSSFNHAIASTVAGALRQNAHEVFLHDLYADGFDPVISKDEILRDAPLDNTINAHCEEIAAAEGIVIVHPNWWGMPPAILKGWIDRVIRPGVAYEFKDGDDGEGVPVGLLKARAALVFNTSNTPRDRELDVFGDPLETLWKNCIFGLCGVSNFQRRNFGVIVGSSEKQRRLWLNEAAELAGEVFGAAS